MSRSLSYVVTFGNNKTKLITGLYNSHGVEYNTSHFNGTERGLMLDKIKCFENNNKKRIKSRRLVWNTYPSSRGLKSECGSSDIVWDFPTFRQTLDSIFEKVNGYKGNLRSLDHE